MREANAKHRFHGWLASSWGCSPFVCSNVFPVGEAMPVHPQHEHGIIPGGPATGLAPLGYAQLNVQAQVALWLRECLNLHTQRHWWER